ncbi:MAG: phosphoenolpyruvate--protein phosphotransferase [Lachnospiraceae bacterium]|nr:phosphoenolpyruvate--protein phosphotransferase [Lachnospiraceae bacterium]
MLVIQGKGVSAGVAVGPLYFYRRAAQEIIRRIVGDTDAEWKRFEEASAVAAHQLGILAEKAREEAGDEAALLFETHQMMAEDMDFVDAVQGLIRDAALNAEAAVMDVSEQFAEMFSSMDDEYMQARAADIRDVAGRIVGILTGVVSGGIDSDVPVILASDDLAPSETIQMDKSKILGFITAGGSGSSHTAILARTMGIPAIIGVGDALKDEFEGRKLYIDGETGEIVIQADQLTAERMLTKQAKQQETRRMLSNLKGLPNETKDGQSIQIYCNIGSVEDVDAVIANDGGGIGLFRSEFLYLQGNTYPTEEEQFEAYRTVASLMKGKRVIIRTLDIGADKQADYFGLAKEENPAMGLRAIRICLSRPEIFKTQLRALYRASAYGKVAILFPMITSEWEVRECKRACLAVQQELKTEGIPFDPDTELGIMIETPAAVMMSDVLAELVDFFSVGTNDLTQYMLACDRQCDRLGKFFDPHHPAVLRAIRTVAENAHKAGKWIGICGELAADPTLTEAFLAMGIDELSVTPGSVLPLRHAIRNMDDPKARKRALKDLLEG